MTKINFIMKYDLLAKLSNYNCVFGYAIVLGFVMWQALLFISKL